MHSYVVCKLFTIMQNLLQYTNLTYHLGQRAGSDIIKGVPILDKEKPYLIDSSTKVCIIIQIIVSHFKLCMLSHLVVIGIYF